MTLGGQEAPEMRLGAGFTTGDFVTEKLGDLPKNDSPRYIELLIIRLRASENIWCCTSAVACAHTHGMNGSPAPLNTESHKSMHFDRPSQLRVITMQNHETKGSFLVPRSVGSQNGNHEEACRSSTCARHTELVS